MESASGLPLPSIPLTLAAFMAQEVRRAQKVEAELSDLDSQVQKTAESKNALESYVIEMKGRLQREDAEYITYDLGLRGRGGLGAPPPPPSICDCHRLAFNRRPFHSCSTAVHGLSTAVKWLSGTGEGKLRNRRNLERQHLARQKCAKLCHRIWSSEAIFLGVIFSALGMHTSVVPNNKHPDASKKYEQPSKQPSRSLQETTATTQRPTGNTTTIRGLCFFLCHSLGILYQILQWYLKIGVKFSLCQILAFKISHIPNFRLPYSQSAGVNAARRPVCPFPFCSLSRGAREE